MRITRVVALICIPFLAACGRPSPSAIRYIVTATSSTVVVTLPPVTTTTSAPVLAHAVHVPQRASRAVAPRVSGDIYDALAMCESGMRQVTAGPFHSYFQWMLSTWHSASGLPGPPESYDYATQKAVVMAKFPLSSWHSQFPACSRRLGV